jgi:hypothetical protein
LDLIESKRHTSKEGLLELCQLRDQMNYRKVKNKWTTEEIKKVLEENPTHIEAHFDPNQAQLIHNERAQNSSWLERKQGNNRPSQSTG